MSNEIKGTGNSYTAEFWEYDPRSGRRWNLDPVRKTYESPYAAFGNSPISVVDPDGSDTLTFTLNKTIKKEIRSKSGLDGTPSKVIIPGSTTTTGNIDIRQGDGADVFYYQSNTTTVDAEGNSTTVNGKLQQFNPTGSASNFYRTGGWSGVLGAQYDDRNVLAMLAPRWLLKAYAEKSSGPQKWAYQTALANQSDLPFIASLQQKMDAAYTISTVYGVARMALVYAVESNSINIFGANGGYSVFGRDGLKIGNYKIEALYANQAPGTGTIFSLKQMSKGGNLLRWDYGLPHGGGPASFHSTFRFNIGGNTYGSSAQYGVYDPFRFWKFKK